MLGYLAMSYKDSDYTLMINIVCWPKRINFGVETHLDGGVMSTFVFPLTTIAQVTHFNVFWQYSSQEGPQRFWLHCHECHRALTLTCQNSPWWQVVSAVITFCLLLAAIARFTQRHGRHVWCALIGIRCKVKLATRSVVATWKKIKCSMDLALMKLLVKKKCMQLLYKCSLSILSLQHFTCVVQLFQ